MRSGLVALSGAALIFVACSETPVQPSRVAAGVSSDVLGSSSGLQIIPPSVFPPIELAPGGVSSKELASRSASSMGYTPGDIKYWGGGVIHTQRVVAIYYSATKVYGNAPKPGSITAGAADASLVGY